MYEILVDENFEDILLSIHNTSYTIIDRISLYTIIDY